VCGCHFRAKDESGNLLKEDIEFIRLYGTDIRSILINVCGFDESTNSKLIQEAIAINSHLVD
jgi:hypothetical protein